MQHKIKNLDNELLQEALYEKAISILEDRNVEDLATAKVQYLMDTISYLESHKGYEYPLVITLGDDDPRPCCFDENYDA